MAVNNLNRYNQNNIHVETEYENIILVDPNKVVDSQGNVSNRLVDHENLVFYANLETKIIPRTKLAIGDSFDSPVLNTTIASFAGGDEDLNLNFLKPKNKKFFDTSWSDEYTGKGARQGKSLNQNGEYKVLQNGQTRFNSRVLNYEDTQTLGITSISVKISSAGVPTVDITMEDVRGRTLFEQGENSIYSVFFNLPYPTFYLTLKGYYGKAIRYQLNLMSFNATLKPDNGNFEVKIHLMGRSTALLSDSIVGFARNVPKMDQSEVVVNATSANAGSNFTNVKKSTTSKGLQKLNEVYSIYESKGLIEKGFPRLTLEEFIGRAEKYENIMSENIKKGDFTFINDINDFQDNLNNLKRAIYTDPLLTFLDTGDVIFKDGNVCYPFKENLSYQEKETSKKDIESKLKEYLDKLKNNKTFGENGKYKIGKDTKTSEVYKNIPFSILKKEIDLTTLTDNEYTKTYFLRYNKVPDNTEKNKLIADIQLAANTKKNILNQQTGQIETVLPFYFKFGDKDDSPSGIKSGSFLDEIDKMQKNLDTYRQDIETKFTKYLADQIVTESGGLGFVPTIRNVFAILFAGLDAFYRLMDDTHEEAWKKRQEPKRLTSIIPQNKNFGVDAKNLVPTTNLLNNENIVYPWPQYFIKEKQSDNTELYVVKYPGDPAVINQTAGFDFNVWPEIRFTENYLTATTQKTSPVLQNAFSNTKNEIKFLPLNSLEYSSANQPYQITNSSSFLYEIFERNYIGSFYGKLNRGGYEKEQIDKFLGGIESENIKTSITENNSYDLQLLLKNFKFTYDSFLNELKTLQTSYVQLKNSIFVTPYLKSLVENNKTVFSVNTLNDNPVSGNITDPNKIKNFIKSTTTNDEHFLDLYPFNDLTWLKNNMAGGSVLTTSGQFYNTETYTFLDTKKTIGRINSVNNETLTTFTNNEWLTNFTQPFISTNDGVSINNRVGLNRYYKERTTKNYYITESKLNYGNSYSGNVGTNIQTTSLLNTPYFINSIYKGVEGEIAGDTKSYTTLGYLYLNSLPLITTKEKIKKLNSQNNTLTDLDYLAATLNKFSAIHEMPYAWVLKYGSIWYRYKKYVEEGVDILDDVWSDFDYNLQYDNDGLSGLSRSYVIKDYTGGTFNFTSQKTEMVPNSNNVLDSLNVGFYPNFINKYYYFLNKKDLFTGYTQTDFDLAYNEGLRVGNSGKQDKFFNYGFDTNNPLRSLNFKSYYQTFELTDKIAIVPSCGGIGINQTLFECFDDSDKIKIEVNDNSSVHNGAVRSLWGLPNFGYFDNELIKKPNYDEYLKVIYTDTTKEQTSFELLDNTSTYSKIDEIISIFNKDILDEFETLFLTFCKRNFTADEMILNGENYSATYLSSGGDIQVKQKNIFEQINSIFTIEKNKVTLTNEQNDGITLAKQQINNLTNTIAEFLNFNCVLRISNPGDFKRLEFSQLSNIPELKPDAPIVYNNYVIGTLPGDGSNVTLLQSRALKNDEWKNLETYVGNFYGDKIKYSDSGSTLTDFFIDMNVEFTTNNIKQFYPLIKLYGKEKLKDPTLNKVLFENKLSDFMKSQKKFSTQSLENTFSTLNKDLPNTKITPTAISSSVSGDVNKLEHYTIFKTLNDKWIAGSDFKNRTIFEDFLFLDRANRDIGNEFTIMVQKITSMVKNKDDKSFLSLVSEILSENDFTFFPMPAYINFYGLQEAVKKGEPIPVEIPNSMFGTYLDVDYLSSRPKFLCIYVGKPSEHLATGDNSFTRFNDDSFDLRKSDNPLVSQNKEPSKSNMVVGFNVDFGTQNQNIFTSLGLGMDEKKNTSESISQTTAMGNSVAGDKVGQQSASLYNLYKTRSYVCTVTSMGITTIQPTMYFNLRHVPLFYGPYWIMEVNHSISVGKFETTFKGMRMPLYSLPRPNGFLASVNQSYLNYWKEQILNVKKTEEATASNNVDNNNNATINNGVTKTSEEKCTEITSYRDIQFVDVTTTQISLSELKTILNSLNDDLIASFLYGVAISRKSNDLKSGLLKMSNYNLFEISMRNKNYPQTNLFNGQVCVDINGSSEPLTSFSNFDDSVKWLYDIYKPFNPLIKDLVTLNKNGSNITDDDLLNAYALTQLCIFRYEAYGVSAPIDGQPNGQKSYSELPSSANEIYKRYQDKIQKPSFEQNFNIRLKQFLEAYNEFY